MIEKSSRTIAAIIAVLMIVSAPFAGTHPALAASSSPTGVMIALYTYPGASWTAVANAKLAHPSVPVVAIINPNNGPGDSRDANYVSGIKQLHAAGVVVLGYDATGYASNSASSVKSLMDSWKSLYTIDGIFFDEMANWSGAEGYYTGLTHYAKSLGYKMTVGNPGTDTISSYVGTVDNLMIYENPGIPPLSALRGWHTGYDKSNFSMIAFGVGSLSTSFLSSASNDVGYIYITNDVLPNPYDSVPSYFGTLVADLDTGSSGATAPSAPTGLGASAVSTSQIDLSWTAPSSNGGSAITGYKIAQSLNGSSTWSTLVANTGKTTTSYSNTGLLASTAYTYRVSAINAAGTSSPSNIASATTIGLGNTTVPSAPTGLGATAISSSQINLSWTAPSSNGGSAITGYEIDRSADAGTTWSTSVANTGNTGVTYSNTGLSANTTYTYRVSAINAAGTSSTSNTASATTLVGTTTGSTVTVTVKAIGLTDGSQITGLWTTLKFNGTTIKSGYTLKKYTVTAGTTYTVTLANYQNYVFDHWGNGNTNPIRTITPHADLTLYAYYQQ